MPFLGLLMYFFCLYIRPQDWVESMMNLPVDYLVFGFIFVTGFFTKSLSELKRVMGMTQTKLMVYCIIVIYASNFFNGHFDEAWEFAVKYIRFLFIFITFSMHIDNFKKMKWLFLFIIALTVALAFQGVYQKEHGVGWAGQPLGWLDRIVWVGLWDGMNVLCLLFVVSFPFMLQFISNRWSFTVRIFALAAIPIVLWGIYLTESRGGFMSLLVVLLLHFRTRFQSKLGIFFGVILVCVMIAFSPSRFGDFNDDDDSASYRIEMWQEAFEMVTYDPILGIGKGNFVAYTNMLIAHNSFLEVMGETGIVGLFFWLSLLYVALSGLIQARALAQTDQEKSLMEGLLICIVGYLFTSLFITAEFELLYVLLALATAAAYLKGVVVRYELPDMKKIVGIQIAGMASLFFVTRIYFKVF